MTAMLECCDKREKPVVRLLTWPEMPQKNLELKVPSTSPVVLSVLTLYSESVASEYGRFAAFLNDLLGEGAELCGTAVAFENLQNSTAGLLTESESSDVVVLITREEELPLKVRHWLASWLKQAHADSAVICLLADGVYHDSATWHGVHRACDEAGVAFFATGFKADAIARPQNAKSAPGECKTHCSGAVHWGINE
jgi:hypothetical protein